MLNYFCDENNRLLEYHLDLEDSWMISNYAGEDITYNKQEKQIQGKMYHVTGHDAIKSDGQIGILFSLSDKDKLAIPLLIGNNLQSIFISQKTEYGVDFINAIIIGNKNSLRKMPKFRNNQKHNLLEILLKNR